MAEIEHPEFDELATGELADVEERGEALIDDAHIAHVKGLARTVGTYWCALADMEIPDKDATRLTREWMNICAWEE